MKLRKHKIVSLAILGVLIGIYFMFNISVSSAATEISGSKNGLSAGSYVLTGDTTLSGQIQVSSGQEYTIDLAGHNLTMSNNTYFMFMGGTLNIKDSVGGGVIYATCQPIWMYSGGTFNMYGGIFDGSKMTSTPQQGGCVNLARSNMGASVFNMYGGTIRNFKASQYGGAVYVGSTFSKKTPVFNMYGGTIENCYAPAGSAVYVDDSGDGPGYFYVKGGTKQAEGGENKVTIKCDTYNGEKVPNAIYNYGYMGLEGVVDIDGIVYLDQNNWASTVTHFIKITGRLVVVGDGYIDVDTAYPGSNAIVTGHTVVENVTQTVGGTDVVISQREFYTYSSYFIKSTKGLMVSAGFDPTKNELDSKGSPANWPTYQADSYSKPYTYVDVMGQTMLIQSSDSPGDKRQMQNYNYLIYTERADLSEDYAEFYSIKISKQDIATGNPLNGALFSLKKKVVDGDGNVTYEVIGSSGVTGDSSDGVDIGETYIYLSSDHDGKLMIEDGIYVLVEDSAPAGYVARGELATIEIKHVMNESTGQLVSVVEVVANNKVLTTTEQIIDSTYGDKGYIVNKEVVLYLNNSTEAIEQNIDYQIRIEKYQDSQFNTVLSGAMFQLLTVDGQSVIVATGTTDESGILNLKDLNGSVFTFSNGDSYELYESKAPDDFYLMDDSISLSVDDSNHLLIDGVILNDGQTLTMEQVGGSATHGGWAVSLSGNLLTIKVYNEKMPPTWSLTGKKYGTQKLDALALAGAKFTLYVIQIDGNGATETEIISVISSDGTDGYTKGTLAFVDNEGRLLKLQCDATYILRETYAPLGYELIDDIIIDVNEDGSAISVTQNNTVYSNASYDAENKLLTFSITNDAVYHMPETGGGGIYPLISAGILMMCVSVVCMVVLLGKKDKPGREESEDMNEKGD